MGIFSNKKTAIVVLLAMILAFFIYLIAPVSVRADTPKSSTLQGLNQAATGGYLGNATENTPGDNSGIITDVPSAIGKVIGALLSFLGAIFFILIIYGGFRWMTARGNEQEVTKAKDLITAAVIGLIIILAAYAITSYVGTLL